MSRSRRAEWFWCLRRSFTAKPIANARGLNTTLLVKTFLAFYILVLLLAAPVLVRASFDTVKISLQKYFAGLLLYFALSFVLAMTFGIAFLLRRKRFRISRVWNVAVFSFSHTLFTAFVIIIYKKDLEKWHADLLDDEIGLSFGGTHLIIMVFVSLLSTVVFIENLRALSTISQS